MAEKNFIVSKGLDLNGDLSFDSISRLINWGSNTLGLSQTGNLQFNNSDLATTFYVDTEIGNINIPDAYITSISQGSSFLAVNNGELSVSLGGGLRNDNGYLDIDFPNAAGSFAGSGLSANSGLINVNTSYVANAIAGSGLVNNQGFLDVALGMHMTTDNSGITVDGYGLFQSWTQQGGGLYLNGPSGIAIDYSAASNSLAGSGLVASNATLTVDYSTIASNLSGFGLTVDQGTLAVNSSYVGQTIQGKGLRWFANNNTLQAALGDNLVYGDFDVITLAPNVTIGENLIVTGNLTVNGNTTTINTETLNVEDNIIVLNHNLSSQTAPTTDAGIEVERGSATNAKLYWDETADAWKAYNGTSTITLGSSYITSTSNTFSVTGGVLDLNTDTVGNLLEYSLMLPPTGKQAVTYVDGAGFVTDAPSQYGPKVLYAGFDANTSYGASIINAVGRTTVNTQTYSTVGTIPLSASSFDVYITMVDSGNSLARTSRVTGSIGSYTVEYTEYGIVEVGQSSILAADIKVEYDSGVDAYVISATGQGTVVADIKYTNVA